MYLGDAIVVAIMGLAVALASVALWFAPLP